MTGGRPGVLRSSGSSCGLLSVLVVSAGHVAARVLPVAARRFVRLGVSAGRGAARGAASPDSTHRVSGSRLTLRSAVDRATTPATRRRNKPATNLRHVLQHGTRR